MLCSQVLFAATGPCSTPETSISLNVFLHHSLSTDTDTDIDTEDIHAISPNGMGMIRIIDHISWLTI